MWQLIFQVKVLEKKKSEEKEESNRQMCILSKGNITSFLAKESVLYHS